MSKKIIYHSFFILLIFIQCGKSKEMSKENYVEFAIYSSNWVLTDWTVNGNSNIISTEKPITIEFDELNKKISGSAGCNQYFGNYKLREGVLSTGPLGSTMMYCTEEIMNQETGFLGLFEPGVKISIKNSFLLLENDNNQLKFKPIEK